ncbi:MAG: hypothetical protein H7X88_07635 [Gloeobacteraceae cyanobacterium ES-bin-316]|nr:hypothetical protein [Ferruginibacter sp.]
MKLYSLLFFGLISFGLLVFSSCKDEKNEDLTPEVNKNGSVETSVTVEHADSLHDVLVTKHIIWNKGSMAGTFEHRDTVPALGTTSTMVKDDVGNERNVDATKEYEIFITVK